MKLKKMSCFNVSRFRVLVKDFFALTVSSLSYVRLLFNIRNIILSVLKLLKEVKF